MLLRLVPQMKDRSSAIALLTRIHAQAPAGLDKALSAEAEALPPLLEDEEGLRCGFILFL